MYYTMISVLSCMCTQFLHYLAYIQRQQTPHKMFSLSHRVKFVQFNSNTTFLLFRRKSLCCQLRSADPSAQHLDLAPPLEDESGQWLKWSAHGWVFCLSKCLLVFSCSFHMIYLPFIFLSAIGGECWVTHRAKPVNSMLNCMPWRLLDLWGLLVHIQPSQNCIPGWEHL